MTLQWIIERLKVNGEGTKQEVLNALENASIDDLTELWTNLAIILFEKKKGNEYE